MFEIVMGIDDFLIQLVKYCTSCPTITDSNKKTTKIRHLRPLNRKRRN